MDTTWGRASVPGGAAVMSVTGKLHGDFLRVLFMSAVNIGSVHEMHQAKEINGDEARKAIGEYIRNLKKLFKQETGSALKLKQVGEEDSFEIVGNPTSYGALRRGYYRLVANFDCKA